MASTLSPWHRSALRAVHLLERQKQINRQEAASLRNLLWKGGLVGRSDPLAPAMSMLMFALQPSPSQNLH